MAHREGDREDGLCLARIAARCHEHRGGSPYLVANGEIKLLVLIRHDLGGKGLIVADEDTVNNHRTDPGRNNAEEGDDKILNNEETAYNGGRVYNEDNSGALPLLNEFADDEGENIHAARRAAAQEGKGTARTDTKAAEECTDYQGNFRVGRGCEMKYTAQHVGRDQPHKERDGNWIYYRRHQGFYSEFPAQHDKSQKEQSPGNYTDNKVDGDRTRDDLVNNNGNTRNAARNQIKGHDENRTAEGKDQRSRHDEQKILKLEQKLCLSILDFFHRTTPFFKRNEILTIYFTINKRFLQEIEAIIYILFLKRQSCPFAI